MGTDYWCPVFKPNVDESAFLQNLCRGWYDITHVCKYNGQATQSGKRQYFPPIPYPNRFTYIVALLHHTRDIYIGLICDAPMSAHSVRYPFAVISSHLEVQGYQRKNEGL